MTRGNIVRLAGMLVLLAAGLEGCNKMGSLQVNLSPPGAARAFALAVSVVERRGPHGARRVGGVAGCPPMAPRDITERVGEGADGDCR